LQLCDYVLQASTSESLVSTTLKTLLRFLNWIPLGYIFETTLIETIVLKYYVYPQFRVDALKCLVEIGSLDIGPIYQQKFVDMYRHMLDKTKNIHLPPTANLAQLWENGTEEFIQSLALFISGFFRPHLEVLERECPTEMIEGLDYLVKIARIGDWELLKICVDFWSILSQELYQGYGFPFRKYVCIYC
jgi:exportin-1